MQIRPILVHGHRLIVQDTVVAGGTDQLDHRKQHQIRRGTADMIAIQRFDIMVIKFLCDKGSRCV